MALHLYIEKEKIIFASKDDKTSFGKAETALLSAQQIIIKNSKEYGFQRI